MLSLFDIGALSVSDSTVTTDNCYEANKTQTLCFTIYNGSTDSEWLTMTRATLPVLPSLWQVSCKSQDATDSSGNPVHFTCSTPSTNEVVYVDNDIESPSIGEVSAGSSWGFCIDVNVPGANGPRIVNWGVYGDREPGSAEPHDVEGQTTIEECMPLMLKPSSMAVEGCNGITQTLTFELWNHSAGNGTFNLTYNVPSGNATFTGPSSFSMSNGEIVTFTVQLAPDLCLSADTELSATIEAEGSSQYDSSTITHTITSLSGWQVQTSRSITPTMDNAVVWASYADGGLWSIGGYGSKGATQRYDPDTGTWSTHTPETVITPTIEYPMDGCYGLNDQGHEIVVLFPDTIVTGSLHIYNITQDNWYTETIPAFYPEEGRWGQDIVSLLNIPGVNQNVCYLSGGSPQEGGGRTRDLWVYYPDTNSGSYLGAFYFPPYPEIWFNFHASWYVPWVGDEGAICVGGGIDHKSNIASATQCYDLKTGSFRGVNADLGPLPEPWWGMADGWQTYHGRYQIWIANGVAQDGTLLPASAYADETTRRLRLWTGVARWPLPSGRRWLGWSVFH
jgi:hypothetical protein